MELPPSYKLQTKGNKEVYRLKKSLYGLKQSPRAWFGRFTSFMSSIGYKQSNSDHTLFLKHNGERITTLIVHVDDMIVTGDDPEERKALQEQLARQFEMKDRGKLKCQYQRKEEIWLLGEVKKQEVVARSSAETEYRGMAKAICELLWIRNLLQDLHMKQVGPMKLYCDNKAACDIAHSPVQHDRTKHVEVDRHFIKEKLEAKLFEVPHVRSQDELADVLSKAVSNQAFNCCTNLA
eukprot:PITA_25708